MRRLWAEEVHDAVIQSSFTNPNYSVPGFSTLGFPNINFAMQLPDVVGTPTAAVSVFLDAFLRGNRDDGRPQKRRLHAAVAQPDERHVCHVAHPGDRHECESTDPGQNLSKPDDDLVNALFLNILSRYPTDAEKGQALAALKVGTRTQGAQDIVWALYNKVDFIFNY